MNPNAELQYEPGRTLSTLLRRQVSTGDTREQKVLSRVILQIRTARLIWIITLMSGCATANITDTSGNTRVERSFGLINIELAPCTSAVVADAWSFGYASGSMGATVGTVSPRCLKTAAWYCGLNIPSRPKHSANNSAAGRIYASSNQ